MNTADRVRAHSAQELNRQIDQEIGDRVHSYATRSREEVTARIGELDRE